MKATIRTCFIGLSAAGMMLYGSLNALAAGPVALSDKQLDLVTAGGATVFSSTDANAYGALALAGTTSNSFVVPEASPYPGQPNLGPAAGVSEGTSLAVGTNLGMQGEPPTSTGTSVQTAGVADGNLVINSTVNQTVHGAGGVTFQAGWTVVYGAWIGI